MAERQTRVVEQVCRAADQTRAVDQNGRATDQSGRAGPYEFHDATGSPTTSRMPSSWLDNPKSNPWRRSHQNFNRPGPVMRSRILRRHSDSGKWQPPFRLPSSSRVIEKRVQAE
ncbi:hypothetical protein ZIOFF_005177 [Zingiber officinale]|uniref:Uncharacterized protein n=1 Tax=Zingiber officinale TaxID=94328 RepID=A0A8J5M1D1_ZINOF|nr:hypothetical protein ZIOFF_005177 [Zingiber officinale]